jgi:hypothetical protein
MVLAVQAEGINLLKSAQGNRCVSRPGESARKVPQNLVARLARLCAKRAARQSQGRPQTFDDFAGLVH